MKNKLGKLKTVLENIIKKIPYLGFIFFYNYTEEGNRLKNMLIHKNIRGYPKTKGKIKKDIIPTKQDVLLTKRLLKAYKKTLMDVKKYKKNYRQDIWTFLKKGPHVDIFHLLQKEDVDDIAYYLCNMSRMGITHGITQGKIDYQRIISDPLYRRWHDLHNLDSLIRLAEAIGILPLENPEQGKFGLSIFSNPNKIINEIKNRIKIEIVPPQMEGGLYQLSTSKGGVHFRDLNAIYTSLRYKEILKTIRKPRVCEIGAGIGKTAYYSYLLGINDYTIIDLPYINIIQGFYLVKSLPKADIFLYGEDIDKKNSITILPDWSLKKMHNKQFDLILNQDSFPEIDKKTVLDYLKQIKQNTKFFLSINQESQGTMMTGNLRQHILSDLISDFKGFEKLYRFPYWMREGYVEELYKIQG